MMKYYLLFLYDNDKKEISFEELLGYTDNLYKANIYKRYLETIKEKYTNMIVVMKIVDNYKRLCVFIKGMQDIGLTLDEHEDTRCTMYDLQLELYRGRFGNFAVYPIRYIQVCWETYGDQLSYVMYRLRNFCYLLGSYADKFIKNEECVFRIKSMIESIIRHMELYVIREECAEELSAGNLPEDLQLVRSAFLADTGLDIVEDGMNEDYFFKVFSESDYLNAFCDFDWMGVDTV